jgi:hypothetical protein
MFIPDDYSSDTNTTGSVAIGSNTSGYLDTNDIDWLKVTLQAGVTYVFSLSGKETGNPYNVSQMLLTLYDGTSWLGEDYYGDFKATGPAFQFTPVTAGNYYLGVRSFYYDAVDAVGDYTVAAAVKPPDPISADIHTTGVLETSGPVHGTFEVAGDVDWYKFHAEAGQHYRFSESAASAPSYVQIYDSNGHALTTDTLEPAIAGDYFISIRGNRAGEYDLRSIILVDDYSENNSTPGALLPGATIRGGFQYVADVDRFNMEVQAGQIYKLDLSLSRTGLRGLYFDLFDAAGNFVGGAEGQDYANIPRTLTFTATASGNYSILVGSYDYVLSVNTSYTLSATALGQPPLLAGAQSGAPGLHKITDNIVLTFNEAIKLVDGQITLHDPTGTTIGINLPAASNTLSSTLVVDPVGKLKPGTTYTLEIAGNAIVDAAGNHFAGLKGYTFTTAPAVADGGDGDDYLIGTLNGAALHGGAGVDTAIYGGRYSDHTIVAHDGVIEISHGKTSASKDVLDGVERLSFDDASIALDINGAGGQAYRLYQAAFNRAPDQAGLGYWIARMDDGVSLNTVANGFVSSAEFAGLYGNAASDTAFITLLYNNVLHRAPDAGGQAYWLDVLQQGLTRAQTLAYFSESNENQAALIGIIGKGFEYIPYGG